jgi:hypothetical protein
MPWRIYYREGRRFGSEDGAWIDAPPDGVLAIVEVIGERRTVRSGGDYYRLCEDGSVVCHETADAILHAIGHVDLSAIKFGWCVSPTEFSRVMTRIEADYGG